MAWGTGFTPLPKFHLEYPWLMMNGRQRNRQSIDLLFPLNGRNADQIFHHSLAHFKNFLKDQDSADM